MSNRDELIAVLEGRKPSRIPLAIYEDFIRPLSGDPAWEPLLARGLTPISWPAGVHHRLEGDIERAVSREVWQGYPAERVTLRTPLGNITQLSVQGWVQEHWLKTPGDYRVMEYVVRHTRLEPAVDVYRRAEARFGDRGISLIYAGRSPMQVILVDYAGLERFSYHLAEGFPELTALAEALLDRLLETCRIIAAGPGRYVSLLENLTAEIWGPRRYAQYHLPVYERVLSILHKAGKKVYVHYDGKLACLKELVARTAIDGIESLTTAPEGDLSYAEARAAWPEKVFWANLNVSRYLLPSARLQAEVRGLACQGAPDGRRFLFEISEDLPGNWRESIPVVLDALVGLEWS